MRVCLYAFCSDGMQLSIYSHVCHNVIMTSCIGSILVSFINKTNSGNGDNSQREDENRCFGRVDTLCCTCDRHPPLEYFACSNPVYFGESDTTSTETVGSLMAVCAFNCEVSCKFQK